MIILNGNLLVVGIILALIIYTNFIPLLNEKITETMAEIDFESLESVAVDNKKCSRDCCTHSQWSVLHQKTSKASKSVASNLMCNGGSGGGCGCLEDKDVTYLSERGGNVSSCESTKNVE